MEKRRRILLYGNSVILGALGTSLRASPQYDVSSLIIGCSGSTCPKSRQRGCDYFRFGGHPPAGDIFFAGNLPGPDADRRQSGHQPGESVFRTAVA